MRQTLRPIRLVVSTGALSLFYFQNRGLLLTVIVATAAKAGATEDRAEPNDEATTASMTVSDDRRPEQKVYALVAGM